MLLRLCFAAMVLWTGVAGASSPSGAGETLTTVTSSPIPDSEFNELVKIFKTRGTSAVADYLNMQIEAQENRELQANENGEGKANDNKIDWKGFARQAEQAKAEGDVPRVHTVQFEIHPNEAHAVNWMNHRFRAMGLSHLQFEGLPTKAVNDPTKIKDEKIVPFWWARLLGSPGLAIVGFLASVPHVPGTSMHDYLLMLIPGATVGVLTVLVELTFVKPRFNEKWKKVFQFGGPAMGRVTGLAWVFSFGMMVYYANKFGVDIANRAGANVPAVIPVATAALLSIKSAIPYTLSLVQYAVDIAVAEGRGATDGDTRFILETTGSVFVGGGRVLGMMVPHLMWVGYATQAAFFIAKTLPQLIETNIAFMLQDRAIFRRLRPESAPKVTLVERCAGVLSGVKLINLPQLQKSAL